MATRNLTGGDETYEQALQRRMHSALPPILMEIADRRPADAIQFLAERLYDLKEIEDMEDTSITKGISRLKPNISEALSHLVLNESSHTDEINSERTLSEIDDSYLKHTKTLTLHSDSSVSFRRIGDLFDEDDIS